MLTLMEIGAQYGIPGFVIVLQYAWIWRQERRMQVLNVQLQEESKLRVKDAQEYTQLALQLQRQVTDAVDKVSATLAEATRGQDHD